MSGHPEKENQTALDSSNTSTLDIISVISDYLTSDKDYRSVISDVFEIILKNLSAHSIYLFKEVEGNNKHLYLDFYNSLDKINLDNYILNSKEGITSEIIKNKRKIYIDNATKEMLNGEDKYNPYLLGRSSYIYPIIKNGQIKYVLKFLFNKPVDEQMKIILSVISNLLTNYLMLIKIKKNHSNVTAKFSLLKNYENIFANNFDLNNILSSVMNVTAAVLSVEVGLFLLFNQDKSEAEIEINWGLSYNDIKGMENEKGISFLDFLIEYENILVVNDFNTFGYSFANDNIHINSIIAKKLNFENDRFGLFIFANKMQNSFEKCLNLFNKEDETLFALMLEQIKHSINKYLLYKKIISVKKINDNILKSINCGVITVDLKGFILSSNNAGKKITNIKELSGTYIKDVFPFLKFDKNRLHENNKDINEIKEYEFEKNNNTYIFVFVINSLKDENEKVIGAVITFYDITEQTILRKRIRRTEHLAALGELSAGLAHEIKNPLTSIKGFNQLLPERLDDKEFLKKFSKMIVNEITRINDITERLLTFAKPNIVDFNSISVISIIDDVLMLLEYQLKKKNIKVKMEIDKEIPNILGQRDRLLQVFLNIIINSIYSMSNDGILTVRINKSKNILIGKKVKGAVIIEINDNGKGIDKSNLNKIFNPFFTTKKNGTGLGLSISYRIIEEHNGAMEVQSKKNEWTEIKIILPSEESIDA